MIGKLGQLLSASIAYVSVGSMLALLVGAGWLWGSGRLDQARLVKIAAILEGRDLDSVRAEILAERERASLAEVSLADEALARARLARDLDLREQTLRTASSQLRGDLAKLADETSRYQLVKETFERQLVELREQQVASGQESTRLLLENLKPAQAKEQILLMAASGEMEEAVLLLAAMPVGKQAKVISEFKSDQENQLVATMLRMLRSGEPQLTVINEAEMRLQPTPSP